LSKHTAPSSNVINNSNTTNSTNFTATPAADISITEAFTTAELRWYYPNSANPAQHKPSPLDYTFYLTTNFSVMKKMVSASFANISVTTGLKNYQQYTFLMRHLNLSDYPDGIGINDEYPDGMLMYRNQLSALPNLGSTIAIPMSAKDTPDYQDEISSDFAYAHFGIKLVDFASIDFDSLKNTTSSDLLSAAGLTKSDLNAQLNYDLVVNFQDGSSESKHIRINIDGNKMGDYSMERQDYTE
jgi:hypothetical protein